MLSLKSPRWLIRWLVLLFPFSLLVLSLAFRISDPLLLREARLKVFDAFQRLKPREYRNAPVRIIDLDDETLARFGQWPWPRTQIAELIRSLNDYGAAVIAFDIVFAEPDRTSPKQVFPLWADTEQFETLQKAMHGLPDHDQLLAQTIKEAGNVVTGFALIQEPSTRHPLLKAGFREKGANPRRFIADYSGAVVNLPELEKESAGNGHFNKHDDQDGIIRRVPLVLRFGEDLYPSLVSEALRVKQGRSGYVLTSAGSRKGVDDQKTGIIEFQIGEYTVPTDRYGNAFVYYTRESHQRVISASKVLAKELKPGALDGKIVFIGTSAAGLKDLRSTPLDPAAAGVSIHAQLAEQILLGDFLKRPDWAYGAELSWLFILGIFLIILLPRVGAVWCAALACTAIGIAGTLSWYAFVQWRLLFDPVYASVMVLAIYIVASLTSFLRSEAERRQIRDAFSRYLAPAMVERLAKNPDQLRLGGESKPMTILFADIRSFTTIAERLSAEELTQFMNQFLTPMTDEILKYNGTIDKYIGDCIMAFWNAPLDDPQHIQHGIQAALSMRKRLVQWNRARYEEHQKTGTPFDPVAVSVGINTGICAVGNFGSSQRFDYSVLGDPVNLAARLQTQAENYGADIVIGEATAEILDNIALLELDLIRVKGKTKPVHIYVLSGDETMLSDKEFALLRSCHEKFLIAYRAGAWDKALELIIECRAHDTALTRMRKCYSLYESRINAYRLHPPQADWDGVFVATEK